MIYIVDNKEFEDLEEAREEGNIDFVKLTKDEFNSLVDEKDNGIDLFAQIKEKENIIIEKDNAIDIFKKVIARQRDKTLKRDTKRNSEMLDLLKIEHIKDRKNIITKGIFNTGLDENLYYGDVFAMLNEQKEQVVYENFILIEIEKIYLYDNKEYFKNDKGQMQKKLNFWHMVGVLKENKL